MNGHDVMELGVPPGKSVGLALEVAKDYFVPAAARSRISDIAGDPGNYLDASPASAELARELLRQKEIARRPKPREVGDHLPFATFGDDLIDDNTREQMKNAMRLPITVAGALMPDAHLGYGLPVGGVLATDNAVIPWAVGVDIACRLRLSVLSYSSHVIGQKHAFLKRELIENTQFGMGPGFEPSKRVDHPVLHDPAWQATGFLRNLRDQAAKQLGTSGGGNHFVEWGIFESPTAEAFLRYGMSTDPKVAILSHSGSRGVGFKIANRYSELAEKEHPELPAELKNLAWLDLDSELGAEYWMAMELAGRFAKANHEVIHHKLGMALGSSPLFVIDHHHNYAWKEGYKGREVVVHRKGATPAGINELGMIPGTMADPGYVVRGLGNPDSLSSASHGAGRTMSRTAAKKAISPEEFGGYVNAREVDLIGGSLDEAPQAYKSIEKVLTRQIELVEPIGRFTPKIVRMAKEGNARRRKKKRPLESEVIA